MIVFLTTYSFFHLDLVVEQHLHQGTTANSHRKSVVGVAAAVVVVAVAARVGLTMVPHPVPIMAVITSPSRLLMTGGTTNLPVFVRSRKTCISPTHFSRKEGENIY